MTVLASRFSALGLLLTCALSIAAQGADLADLAVPLPPGETLLADLGVFQVSWQSYGKEPVAMPAGWTGHFDAETGISCQDWGRVLDRRALLMHSPWHVPAGRTWVDYRLALPQTTPIRLSFGIAMGPDVATPDKSDGVTFSCFLTAEGRQQELMRHHQDKAQWKDYTFDLSPFAGKEVVVRLQVEPGPKNNASFDYSFFGDAKMTVGDAKEPRRSDLIARLTSTRAYQATAKADLTALANNPAHGITPSNLFPYKNALEESAGAWRFSYQGADCRMVYTYRPSTGALDDFLVQVDDGRPLQPASGGRATFAVKRDGKTQDIPARGGKAVKIARDKDTLNVLWEYDAAGRPVRIAWSFRMVGKALEVGARCEEPVVSRFSLGRVGMAPLRKSLQVPYLAGRVTYLPVQNVFACCYLDWTRSHSSRCPQGEAVYEPQTDGVRNALVESGYVTVSPEVGEVLPNLPHAPSPYLSLLGPRIMLDIWGHHQGTYQGDAVNLRTLKDHGVDHLAIIQHVWQRYGYDVKLPDHLPANPTYGGDEGMVEFGRAANECGYVWSLHENYIDLYPDAPSYDPAARVLKADGTPSPAWYNPGTKVQSFGLKCNRALGYAKQTAPEAHRRFATTAAYLDVHTCVPPWHQLDHEANQPMAAMALAKMKFDTQLFQFMRDAHQGPMFGEGNNQFYWAGRCDGVEAQVEGGEDHSPFLDFDLLKLHPQMVNHGMGYYERWFRRGYQHRLGRDTGSMEQIDKYRAQELAYGHAGFVGASQVDNVQWVVREHHLMYPVQKLYGTARPAEIRYEVDGQMLTASAALVVGDTSRQRIRYTNGLTLWVNWRPDPWMVEGHVLPQWGFLAQGPGTQVSTSLRDGKIADYVQCPDYLFADARTSFSMPYRRAPKQIEPRLRSLKHLGGGRVQVTYEWIVNDTLDKDYHCFVHGVHKRVPSEDGIVFQQDHGLPKPTSTWAKGEVIVDGPYEFSVPPTAENYDLTIGLYKDRRVLLTGVEESDHRILLGRLKVKREGQKVTDVSVEKITSANRPKNTDEADFTAHLNAPGTWIDFGPVATDGSVRIDRRPDRLIVFPYPREQPFRVSLDLKALAPSANASRVKVRALAAGNCRDLGPVDFAWQNGRLAFTAGAKGAGRYAVTW